MTPQIIMLKLAIVAAQLTLGIHVDPVYVQGLMSDAQLYVKTTPVTMPPSIDTIFINNDGMVRPTSTDAPAQPPALFIPTPASYDVFKATKF